MDRRCLQKQPVVAIAVAAFFAVVTGLWLSTAIGGAHILPALLLDSVDGLHGAAVPAEEASDNDTVLQQQLSSTSATADASSADGDGAEVSLQDDSASTHFEDPKSSNRIVAQQEAMRSMRARSYLASFQRVFQLFWPSLPTPPAPRHIHRASPRIVAGAGRGASVSVRQAAMVLRAALLQQHLLVQPHGLASTHVEDVTNQGCQASEALWGLDGLQNATAYGAYRTAAAAVLPSHPPQLILSTLGATGAQQPGFRQSSQRASEVEDAAAIERLTELYLFRMYREHMDRERKQRDAFRPMALNLSHTNRVVLRHDITAVTESTGFDRGAEGVCVPAGFADMATLHELPAARQQRPWRPEALRMALLVDLEIAITVAWEALVEANTSASALDPRLDIALGDVVLPSNVRAHLDNTRRQTDPGAAAGRNDDPAAPDRRLVTVCMKPKLRAALHFSMHHQWMFQLFAPPFLEDDLTDREHYEASDRQMADVRLWATLNTKMTKIKGPAARNRPFFYTMGNVVLPSSRGGGSPQGYKGSVHMHLLRDERFIRIRDHRVHTRQLEPRFVVKSRRPLYLFPVLFASDNVGHVMFRYFSALALMDRLRMQRDQTIFAYTVLPSSLLTFADRNIYRAFYQGLHGPWLSVMSTHKAPESILDVSFRLAISGLDGIAQFHKGGGDMDKARKDSHRALLTAVQRMRNLSAGCYQLPAAHADSAGAAEGLRRSPRLSKVVVIRRRSRRIVDDADLVQHYIQLAAAHGVQRHPQDGGSSHGQPAVVVGATPPLLDPTTGRSFELLHVDYEDLTFPQQMAVTASADVLIGPIGAGQCWMMYMQPRSVVVELQIGPTMFCTGEGLNRGRMQCDYSKLSVAAGLHHIGFKTIAKVPCHPLKCDGIVNRTEFVALMGAAFCALGKRQGVASAQCAVPRAPSSRY